MIFNQDELTSIYDFNYVLPDQFNSINALASELHRMTQLLLIYQDSKQEITIKYLENRKLNFDEVSSSTWYRSVYEITEILHRSKINQKHQQQFSLTKALENLNIYIPNDSNNLKEYLQLLYFFYITNYFIFPNKNIFKYLKKETLSFTKSYDDGTKGGIYLRFIIQNILSKESCLYYFIENTTVFDKYITNIAYKIKGNLINQEQDILLNQYSYQPYLHHNGLFQIIDYCFLYSMESYICDLLDNLEINNDNFIFEPLTIPPPLIWKSRYIDVEMLDEFLNSNELITFCKQRNMVVASRDKIKFNQSRSIQFLKDLIAYDRKWIQDVGEGILIETIDQKEYIYALKIAIIIKTYDDLTNKLKLRISTYKQVIPLKTLLATNWSFDPILPSTLPIRFFLLFAHSQYLNATSNHSRSLFYTEFLLPEVQSLQIFEQACSVNTFVDCIDYLKFVYDIIY